MMSLIAFGALKTNYIEMGIEHQSMTWKKKMYAMNININK